jgi:hypothetical protein
MTDFMMVNVRVGEYLKIEPLIGESSLPWNFVTLLVFGAVVMEKVP